MGRQDAASQLQLICYPRAEFPFFFLRRSFFCPSVCTLVFAFSIHFIYRSMKDAPQIQTHTHTFQGFRYKYKSVDNKGAQKADNQIKMRNRHLIPFSGAKCDYLKGNIRVTGVGFIYYLL